MLCLWLMKNEPADCGLKPQDEVSHCSCKLSLHAVWYSNDGLYFLVKVTGFFVSSYFFVIWYMYTCVWIHMCTCGGQRLISRSPSINLHLMFESVFLTRTGDYQLVGLVDQEALSILLFLCPQCWGYRCVWPQLAFTWVLETRSRSSCLCSKHYNYWDTPSSYFSLIYAK